MDVGKGLLVRTFGGHIRDYQNDGIDGTNLNHFGNSKLLTDSDNSKDSKPSASTSFEEVELINSVELAKLLRSHLSNTSISILDCRPMNAYRKGHCIQAEHLLPPSTLLYHRRKGKPDFWSNIRQQLVIPTDCEKNGGFTVILIDDDHHQEDNGIENYGKGTGNGLTSPCSRGNSVQESFPSFLLNKLRAEGCSTFLLKRGEMDRFLEDYPDLCVFEETKTGDGNSDSNDNDLQSSSDRLGIDAHQCPFNVDNVPNNLTLSQKQSSTTLIDKPLLLPLLKIKDLTLANDSTAPKNLRHDSCKFTNDRGDDIKNSGFDRRLPMFRECDGKFVDRDPVNIFATLYLGNAANAGDLDTLRRYNIKYILNVTSDLPNRFQDDVDSFKYLRIPVTDNVSSNLASYFPAANEFIDEAIKKGVGVLVHCLAGVSRSVTFTVAYLMNAKSCSLDDAYDLVKKRKPNIEPNLNFMRQLLEYEQSLGRSANDSGGVTPDSAVSSLSTSSSSVCVDSALLKGETNEQHVAVTITEV